MDQILNMIYRIFMRKMISRGIDAGIKSVGGGRKREAPPSRPEPAPSEDGMTREQVRAQRRARRERRAARAALKDQE